MFMYTYMMCRNKDGYDLGEIDPSLFLYLDGQGHHDPPSTAPSPLPHHHHTTRMHSLSLSLSFLVLGIGVWFWFQQIRKIPFKRERNRVLTAKACPTDFNLSSAISTLLSPLTRSSLFRHQNPYLLHFFKPFSLSCFLLIRTSPLTYIICYNQTISTTSLVTHIYI